MSERTIDDVAADIHETCEQVRTAAALAGFVEQIKRFNMLYKLPCNETPTYLGVARIRQFVQIMKDELDEGYDLADGAAAHEHNGMDDEEDRVSTMTELADLLGDLVVFAFSEARRWGIPLLPVLAAIMESQWTKMGADGKPIYDEALDKVLKGPNYIPPEPAIRKIICDAKGTAP